MFLSEIAKLILHHYLRKKTVIFNIPSAIFIMDIIYNQRNNKRVVSRCLTAAGVF